MNFNMKSEIVFVKHFAPIHMLVLKGGTLIFNSFSVSCNCCHMLITFANSLDPDQDRQNVSPHLGPNCLTL